MEEAAQQQLEADGELEEDRNNNEWPAVANTHTDSENDNETPAPKDNAPSD